MIILILLTTLTASIYFDVSLLCDPHSFAYSVGFIFKQFVYTNNNQDVTSAQNVTKQLSKLWKQHVIYSTNRSKLAIQLKIQFRDGSIASYSQVFIVKVSDFKWVLERFINLIDLKNDLYDAKQPKALIFNYFLIKSDKDNNYPFNYGKTTETIEIIPALKNNFTVGKQVIPLNTEILEWGKYIAKEGNKIIIQKPKSSLRFEVKRYFEEVSYNVVRVLDKANNEVLKFQDFLGNNIYNFTRIIGSTTSVIKDGKIVFKETNKKVQYIEPINKQEKLFTKFITIFPGTHAGKLDIEAKTIDGVFIPYCISLYDGKKAWSFYLTNFENHNQMLKAAITSLMRNKYNHYVIYAHNLSN